MPAGTAKIIARQSTKMVRSIREVKGLQYSGKTVRRKFQAKGRSFAS